MEESKWPYTLSVKKDDCCRGSRQYQQFKAFFWQYIEGPITPWYDTNDLNLSVWWQAIFSQFAFLLSWQMKSGPRVSVNKGTHDLSAISLPVMQHLFDCFFHFLF